MNTKLTLSLDKEVIERARAYAKARGISLSRLFENYLKSISSGEKKEGDDEELSPLIKSLSGVIPPLSDEEVEEEHMRHLERKYR